MEDNRHICMCYSAEGRINQGIDPLNDLWLMQFHPRVDILHPWIRLNMSIDEITGARIPNPKHVDFYKKITQFCVDHKIKIIAKVPMFNKGIHKYGTVEYDKRLIQQVNDAVLWMKILPTIQDWGLWNEPQIGSVPYRSPIKLTGPHWSADDVRKTIIQVLSLAHELKPVPVRLYPPAIERIGVSTYGDFEEPATFLEPLLPHIDKYIEGVLINAYIPLTRIFPRKANFVKPYRNLLKRFPDTKFFPSEQGISDRWMKGRSLEQFKRFLDLSWDIGFPHTSIFPLHSTTKAGDDWALKQSTGNLRNDKMDIVYESLDK